MNDSATFAAMAEDPRLFRFYVYDPGWFPGDDPNDPACEALAAQTDARSRALLAEFEERIASLGGERELRMPEVCAGDTVGLEFAIGLASGLGTAAITWLGHKLFEFFKTRARGASGDVRALRLVALFHLGTRYPEVRPDADSVESIGEVMPPGVAARSFEAVYLYRVRDLASPRVFIVEVASNGDLVTLTERENAYW